MTGWFSLMRFLPARSLAVAGAVLVVALGGAATAQAYSPAYYSGRTAQGESITFGVADGYVFEMLVEVRLGCHPGSTIDYLTPHNVRLNPHGGWVRHLGGRLPFTVRGRLTGVRASGTIVDKSTNGRGRVCEGKTSFRASPRDPVTLGPATVGGLGTDVLVRARFPEGSNGNIAVPYTGLALLVYGSNQGCPSTYAAADGLARSESPSTGQSGLIEDAYVDAAYEVQPYAEAYFGYLHGVFTFHAATNTLVPTDSGGSPFSTVCAMLYSGKPGALDPADNVALAQTHAPLVAGPGIPNNQP
jgi:hypothetical protein